MMRHVLFMHQICDKLMLLQKVEYGLMAIVIFGGWFFLHVEIMA